MVGFTSSNLVSLMTELHYKLERTSGDQLAVNISINESAWVRYIEAKKSLDRWCGGVDLD